MAPWTTSRPASCATTTRTTVTIPPPNQPLTPGISLTKAGVRERRAGGHAGDVHVHGDEHRRGRVRAGRRRPDGHEVRRRARVPVDGDDELEPGRGRGRTAASRRSRPARPAAFVNTRGGLRAERSAGAGRRALRQRHTTTVTIPPVNAAGRSAGESPGRRWVAGEESSPAWRGLRGPSGCVKRAFRARVTGRETPPWAFSSTASWVKRITGRPGDVRRQDQARRLRLRPSPRRGAGDVLRGERHGGAAPAADVPPLRAEAPCPRFTG